MREEHRRRPLGERIPRGVDGFAGPTDTPAPETGRFFKKNRETIKTNRAIIEKN
jgi:hypothetical protein